MTEFPTLTETLERVLMSKPTDWPTLTDALDEALTFHEEMGEELMRLGEEAEQSGDYHEYDQGAIELREQAEFRLDTILAAYRRERKV